jgi:hypothetical protein
MTASKDVLLVENKGILWETEISYVLWILRSKVSSELSPL